VRVVAREILQYGVGREVAGMVIRTCSGMLDSDYTEIGTEQVRKDSLSASAGTDCCPSSGAEIGRELQSIVRIEVALLVEVYRALPRGCSIPWVSFLLVSDRS
jgi:hypothetical protein